MKRPSKSTRSAATTKRRVARKKPAVQNRYEGAYQGWGERSWIPGTVQDARFDADASTRTELIRRSRYWERNNAFVNRLADVYEQYTVGQGMRVVPNSSDTHFNELASYWWQDLCKFIDVNSSQPFGSIQGVMARAEFIDGEVFVYKTFSIETGRPRIQLIESHRVGTPDHLKGEEGRTIVDGIEFPTSSGGRPMGRPAAYWVRTDDMGFGGPVTFNRPAYMASWERIEATRIIHLFIPSRPGMFRGIPALYPVMNDLHDLDDLQMFEMKAAKAASEVANVVTNRTGEANVSASRRSKWNIQSNDASGNPASKAQPVFFESTVGGRTVYISNGEKFEQFQSNRPGVAMREYWDYLVRKICAGVGISSLLVMPFSLQGTVTRADLDVAAAFFRSKSAVMEAAIREIYIWMMGWAVKFDRSLDGAPADWHRAIIRPPRSVTVDVGRNSKALLDELQGGVRNFQDICGELGHDWRHVLRQKAIEAKYIDDLAKEMNVSRDLISQLAIQTVSTSESVSAVVDNPNAMADTFD